MGAAGYSIAVGSDERINLPGDGDDSRHIAILHDDDCSACHEKAVINNVAVY